MPQFEKIRPLENFHIVLWLLKDVCWVMNIRWLGMAMILPALAVAFYITAKWWAYYTERMHNLAVCAWLMANSIWMTGEFFFDDKLRPLAILFFLIGLGFIIWFYAGKYAFNIKD
jgi:hypothetical protein